MGVADAGEHPLETVFREIGRGRPAPLEGKLVAMPAPVGAVAAVVAFTGHVAVAADVPAQEVLAQLPANDLGAPLGVPFLSWLGRRAGATPGLQCLVLVHGGPAAGGAGGASMAMTGSGAGHGAAEAGIRLVPRPDLRAHPRAARALRRRTSVTLYGDAGGRRLITLGRGLAGRWELGVELEAAYQGQGLGRRLIGAAVAICPPGEAVYAQVPAANARSIRAFLGAGFRIIGAEVLYHARHG
jgi:GNAT superfamily N-acetyltransferase